VLPPLERETGVSVFRPDAGVDTGPIVVQKGGVEIRDDDTSASLYFDRLYPLGVDAIADAVASVADGSAEFSVQDESRATHQGLVDDAVARIDWSQDAVRIDRLIRGCDPQPGALAKHAEEPVRLFDGRLVDATAGGPPGTIAASDDGRLLIEARGGRLAVGRVRLGDGAKLPAAESGLSPGERLT
jgi:methionyl-tRNA formyltransferase